MPNQRVSPEMRETFVFAGAFHLTDAYEGAGDMIIRYLTGGEIGNCCYYCIGSE